MENIKCVEKSATLNHRKNVNKPKLRPCYDFWTIVKTNHSTDFSCKMNQFVCFNDCLVFWLREKPEYSHVEPHHSGPMPGSNWHRFWIRFRISPPGHPISPCCIDVCDMSVSECGKYVHLRLRVHHCTKFSSLLLFSRSVWTHKIEEIIRTLKSATRYPNLDVMSLIMKQ